MHSIRNTFVAVGLLAVSFGLYQVSLTPNSESDSPANMASDFSGSISQLANDALSGAKSKVAGVQSKIDDFKSDMASLSGSVSGSAQKPSGILGGSPNFKQPSSTQPPSGQLPPAQSFANLNTTQPPATPPMRSPQMTLPATADSTVTNISAPSTTALSTTDKNNVQTIQYPQSNEIDLNSFPKMKMPEGKNQTSDSMEISQREPVEANRDKGLIDALENQMQFEAANVVASIQPPPAATPPPSSEVNLTAPAKTSPASDSLVNNSFAANNPNLSSSFKPEANKNAESTSDFDASGEFQFSEKPSAPSTAQSIANNDSSFNRLASSTSPASTSTAKDIERSNSFDLDGGFDSNVKLASVEPTTLSYNAAWPKVDQLVASGQHREALKLLSGFYNDASLNGPQRQRLLPNLDALAGKVIYSRENHLAPESYTVSANESLMDIAKKWNVPAQLIYNINQSVLPNPVVIAPGTKLKIVRGPFRTEINLEDQVMTMFLGDLYAGRFPIRVGISGEPKPGEFKVLVKSEAGHSWRDSNGVDYPPGAPENGYGPNWIGLSNSLCIHAIPDSAKPGHHGCIGLSEKDAKDVFGILAENSDVKILR